MDDKMLPASCSTTYHLLPKSCIQLIHKTPTLGSSATKHSATVKVGNVGINERWYNCGGQINQHTLLKHNSSQTLAIYNFSLKL